MYYDARGNKSGTSRIKRGGEEDQGYGEAPLSKAGERSAPMKTSRFGRYLRMTLGLVLATTLASWPLSPTLSASPVPYASEAMAMTRILTNLLRHHLPDPLAQASENWGQQREVSGTRHRIRDWRITREPYQEMRNDGLWRRLTLRVPQKDQLHVGVRNIEFPRRGCLRGLVLTVAERVDVQLEQQQWYHGLRLYACDTRAHCKVGLTLRVEVTSRREQPVGAFLPIYTLKVRILEARLDYDDIVVDHILGLDGKAARVVGDSIREIVRRFKPDFEEKLRRKAEAAVIHVTDNRELHITLDEWFRRAMTP